MLEKLVERRSHVLIKQKREWGEILTSFEARNRYVIYDQTGIEIGSAAEEGGGFFRFLVRGSLGAFRTAKIHIYGSPDQGNQPVELGLGEKVFRWWLFRMEVYDGKERIGAIQRKFKLLSQEFAIEDAQGNELLRVRGGKLKIWTFRIMRGEEELGQISKRWGGVLSEMFSDADTFGIEYASPKLSLLERKLLFVATFLIDFVCFENNV